VGGWILTDGLGNGDVKTQWAQGEGGLLPGGITLLADPEHLNHQGDPSEEHQNGNSQRDPLLRDPTSNTDDGKSGGETIRA